MENCWLEPNRFDVFVTTDKKISYQQNLEHRTIAIVVLSEQQWPNVRPDGQGVLDAVNLATPGFATVDIPYPD